MFLQRETIKHSKQKHVNLDTPEFSFKQERGVATDEKKNVSCTMQTDLP
jgi:hypothetical protein